MNKPLSKSMCEQARTYYYDYICEENGQTVPPEIAGHIDKCRHCQTAANKLKFELFETAVNVDQSTNEVDAAQIAILKLHFAYIDKHITCENVRPLLPYLLCQTLKIRVPTPITVHIDNCEQCRRHLEIIRDLNLNRKQLQRLSWLMADKSAVQAVDCEQARLAIPSVAAMSWDGISADELKHLCTCHDCQDLLYQERQRLIDALPERSETSTFPCESIYVTDIFDYCFPYGIDQADDEYAQFRQSLTSHLRNCRNCLSRMQELHKTVGQVVGRVEPGVVTVYRIIDKSIKAEALGERDDFYAGFPVQVEVMTRDEGLKPERLGTVINFADALREKVSAMNLKPLLKPAVVVAATILIASTLFFHTRSAKGLTLDQIYKAISDIKNVYISKFAQDDAEPQQELWVSKLLNIYITKSEDIMVLWDVSNGLKKMKNLNTSAFETTSLDEETITSIKMKISGYLGLVPFMNFSKIPAGAVWKQITDPSAEVVAEDLEVYDLLWTVKAYDGSDILKRWRVFVDPKTNLPQRTEFYEKSPIDSELLLQSVNVVEYPDNSEIQSVFN
jgi:hypothetical protein